MNHSVPRCSGLLKRRQGPAPVHDARLFQRDGQYFFHCRPFCQSEEDQVDTLSIDAILWPSSGT